MKRLQRRRSAQRLLLLSYCTRDRRQWTLTRVAFAGIALHWEQRLYYSSARESVGACNVSGGCTEERERRRLPLFSPLFTLSLTMCAAASLMTVDRRRMGKKRYREEGVCKSERERERDAPATDCSTDAGVCASVSLALVSLVNSFSFARSSLLQSPSSLSLDGTSHSRILLLSLSFSCVRAYFLSHLMMQSMLLPQPRTTLRCSLRHSQEKPVRRTHGKKTQTDGQRIGIPSLT